MKKFLFGLLAIFVVVIGVVAAAPFLIPASTYGRVAEEQLEAMLGRDVTLASDPSITIFPRLGATIENVEIANAEGFDDPYFARADSLSVAVKWLPLFSRRAEIASLRFDGGEILLHQRTATSNNWTFNPAESPEPTEDESDVPAETAQSFDAVIPRAEFTNMRVQYVDEVSGTTYDANPINLVARLDGLDAPASINGDITINYERFDISASLSSVNALTSGAPTDLQANVSSQLLDLSFEGNAVLDADPSVNGQFEFSSNDLQALTNFANIQVNQNLTALGRTRASGRVVGPVSALQISSLTASQNASNLETEFSGDITLGGNTPVVTGQISSRSSDLKRFLEAMEIDLPPMQAGALDRFAADITLLNENGSTRANIDTLQLDDIDVSGTILANLRGNVPVINATLAIPTLDISPYLSESRVSENEAPAEGGWSEDPIDLSFLHSLNGAFDISIGELTDSRARILDVVVDGELSNGRFTGSLDSIPPEGGRSGRPGNIDPFYSGRLDTDLVLASRADGSNALNVKASGSGITAAALVRFFTGQEVLQGVASIDADIQMTGRSVADFIRSMNGTYGADVADGAILGINLPQLLRSAQTFLETRTLPDALSPEAETDFSSLLLEGRIREGVAEISTMNLVAPFLRATAEGEIDLYNQTLDIHFYPRALTSATGADNGFEGYGIPLAITGGWASPRGSLDTEFIANLAAGAVRSRLEDEARSRLGDDAVSGLIGDALGINRNRTSETTEPAPAETESNTPEPDASEEEEAPTPEDAARNLLRDIINRPRE